MLGFNIPACQGLEVKRDGPRILLYLYSILSSLSLSAESFIVDRSFFVWCFFLYGDVGESAVIVLLLLLVAIRFKWSSSLLRAVFSSILCHGFVFFGLVVESVGLTAMSRKGYRLDGLVFCMRRSVSLLRFIGFHRIKAGLLHRIKPIGSLSPFGMLACSRSLLLRGGDSYCLPICS